MKVRIPPGAKTGSRLRIKGKGQLSPFSGQRGDLYLNIEPEGSMLKVEDTLRVIKIMRLRRDLGLNLVGAAMVLELAQENYQLRSQLNALRQSL